jgi:predicted RNA binding protein YcfA (HicA-like mRNA interferase family)
MPMKFGELIALIEADGWRLKRQRGSHRQYVHPTKRGKVTIAGKPSETAPPGTAASILEQAGLKRRR